MKFKNFISVIMGIILAIRLTPALAEETHPIKHGTATEATISEEVDTADNYDNEMSTEVYMFIPAPEIKNIPNMGDCGIDISLLCTVTIALGLAYLGCNRYANRQP